MAQADMENKAEFEQLVHDLLMDKDADSANNNNPPERQTKSNYPLIVATGNASGQNNTTPGTVYLL